MPVHAKFNREEASNHWTIPSRTLRQLMEHFGPGVELLDVSSDGEHVKFTCFTEKTVNGEGEYARARTVACWDVFQRSLSLSLCKVREEADRLANCLVQRSSKNPFTPPSPSRSTSSRTLSSKTIFIS